MKWIFFFFKNGLAAKLIELGKKLKNNYACLKLDTLIHFTLKGVLFAYKETDNRGDVLAINHVILIAKMCISKYRYGNTLI